MTNSELSGASSTPILCDLLADIEYQRNVVYDIDATKPFATNDKEFAVKYGSATQPLKLKTEDIQIVEHELCSRVGVSDIKSHQLSRSGNKIVFMNGSAAKFALKHDKAVPLEERPLREIKKSYNYLLFLNQLKCAGFSAYYAVMHPTAGEPHWIISRTLDGGSNLIDRLQDGLTRKETLNYLADFYEEVFFNNLQIVNGQTKAVMCLEIQLIRQYVSGSDIAERYESDFADEQRNLANDLDRISGYITSSDNFGELPVTLSITDPAKTNIKFLELPDYMPESKLTECKLLRLSGRRYIAYLLDQGLADDILSLFECPEYEHLPKEKWMAHLQPAEASMARLEEMTRLYKLNEPIADLVVMMECVRTNQIHNNNYNGKTYALEQEAHVTHNTQYLTSEISKMEVCALLYRESKCKNTDAYNSFVNHMQNILAKIKG